MSCSDHLPLSSLLICDPGIVQEKLLNDYLYRIFSSPDHGPPAATSRKPLNFHNLPEHVEQLLQVDSEDEESQGMRRPPEWG